MLRYQDHRPAPSLQSSAHVFERGQFVREVLEHVYHQHGVEGFLQDRKILRMTCIESGNTEIGLADGIRA